VRRVQDRSCDLSEKVSDYQFETVHVKDYEMLEIVEGIFDFWELDPI